MNLSNLKTSISFMYRENHWGRIIILFLIAVNGMLGYKAYNHEPVINNIPYTLTGPAQIMKNQADESMHLAWSLYLAEVLGNVTPDTVDFVKTTVGPLLASEIRNEVLGLLDQQIARIKVNGTSFSFEPRDMKFDPNGTSYIVGRHNIHDRVGGTTRTNRTYEFEWEFRNHQPVLRFMDSYVGAPRTER